jgi:regulator of replication initiation timing
MKNKKLYAERKTKPTLVEALRAENKRLRAENERLRAALSWVAEHIEVSIAEYAQNALESIEDLDSIEDRIAYDIGEMG